MTEESTAQEPIFIKFIGPMVTLTQGKTRFEKGKIYRLFDRERALDLIETGRFQQTRDPAAKQETSRRGVRINRKEPRQEEAPDMSERGDLSQADLTRGGSSDDRSQQDTEIQKVKEPEDDYPRLPSQPFTSKREALEWAEKNLGVKLDKNRSLPELNRNIATEYGKKFGKPEEAEDEEDDTREENTNLQAITVA